MTHPCIDATQLTLSALRAADISGPLDPDVRMSPEVYFSVDTVQGQVQITLHPAKGGLLKAQLSITGEPEWLSLNIGLGKGTFNTGDTLGIIADLRDDDSFAIRPFIRSGREGGEHDTELAEDLRFGGTSGLSTVLHPVTDQDDLSYGEAYHTLVMPLPKRNLSLALHDMRLFHLDAASGIGAHVMTLGSLAI